MIPIISRSSDIKGNPGDVYICWGLQYFLNKIRPNKSHLIINKFNESDFNHYASFIKSAGFVLYAGMPQYNNLDDWQFFYDWDMYTKYLIPWKVRVHTLAGGSGFPSTDMSPKQFSDHLIKNARTLKTLEAKKRITGLATVRDEHGYQLLRDLNQEVHLLPCTATWASRWVNINPSKSNVVGLIPPSPNQFNKDLIQKGTSEQAMAWFNDYFVKIKIELAKVGLDTQVICHSEAEYHHFKKDKNAFYTNDLYCLLNHYGTVHGVISARLHGALPVAGMNKQAVLLGIDTRQSAALPLDVPLIKINQATAKETVDTYLDSKSSYKEVMDEAEQKYLKLLDSVLP